MQLSFGTKLTLTFVLYGIMLTGLSFLVMGKLYKSRIEADIIHNSSRSAKDSAHHFESNIQDIGSKLESINKSRFVQSFLADTRKIQASEELFLNFADAYANIMQLRYIDATGQERIRVDRAEYGSEPYLVAKDDLQNKFDRYYFHEIFNKKSREVWLSKIDLNIEHGKIEEPHKPVIRVGIPIYFKGEKKGILVVNIFMQKFIDDLSNDVENDVYAVDQEGYFLIHPDNNYSWSKYLNTGFLLNDQFPKIGKNILSKEEYFGKDLYSRRLDIDNGENIRLIFKPKATALHDEVLKEVLQLFLIMIGITVLFSPFAYLFTKKFNTTVQELAEANTKITHSMNVKSEFLANMSHEIRTPLNAILGYIELLEESKLADKEASYVKVINKSSKSLLKIIEDILDFSKIESGKLEIDKMDFDPRAEFGIVVDLFHEKCSQKGIELSLVLDDTLPQYIHTDPLRVKQVVSNLISNASKFTSSGKSIKVSMHYSDELLNVCVKDEGKGIAPDKLKQIFEAFSQEDSSTTRNFGGTGLGLSISSKLIELLGGKLKVKSELGVGSEFYFSIPAERGEGTLLSEEELVERTFPNTKVLLVEDNISNQLFMQIILESLQIQSDFAKDGLEAVKCFKNAHYDLVLMDENMPNLNGIEATKQILEYEKENNLAHTPIIALTANALKGDREKFLNAGMDEYLTKPLDKKRLIVVLSQFLK